MHSVGEIGEGRIWVDMRTTSKQKNCANAWDKTHDHLSASFFTSFIPQIGQLPGVGEWICGCITQV